MKVFYVYSRKDRELLDELEVHLALLKRQGCIDAWSDREIIPGTDWEGEILRELESADIILLLVSADFLASDFCYGREMKLALERHERGEARVVPIILRECDWAQAPFAKIQALPKDAVPVKRWDDRDSAWTTVSKGIRLVSQRASENSRRDSEAVPHYSISNDSADSEMLALEKKDSTGEPTIQARLDDSLLIDAETQRGGADLVVMRNGEQLSQFAVVTLTLENCGNCEISHIDLHLKRKRSGYIISSLPQVLGEVSFQNMTSVTPLGVHISLRKLLPGERFRLQMLTDGLRGTDFHLVKEPARSLVKLRFERGEDWQP